MLALSVAAVLLVLFIIIKRDATRDNLVVRDPHAPVAGVLLCRPSLRQQAHGTPGSRKRLRRVQEAGQPSLPAAGRPSRGTSYEQTVRWLEQSNGYPLDAEDVPGDYPLAMDESEHGPPTSSGQG